MDRSHGRFNPTSCRMILGPETPRRANQSGIARHTAAEAELDCRLLTLERLKQPRPMVYSK